MKTDRSWDLNTMTSSDQHGKLYRPSDFVTDFFHNLQVKFCEVQLFHGTPETIQIFNYNFFCNNNSHISYNFFLRDDSSSSNNRHCILISCTTLAER